MNAGAAEMEFGDGRIGDWQARGQQLVRLGTDWSWQLADWIRAGEEMIGPGAIGMAAAVTGYSPGKIYSYLKTSKTYENSRRRQSLAFSHHLEVLPLPEADRERLLDEAEAGKWTTRMLRERAGELAAETRIAQMQGRIVDLERRLKARHVDPEEAKTATLRLEDTVRSLAGSIRKDYRAIYAGIAKWRQSPAFLSLHGNARKSAELRLANQMRMLAGQINSLADKYAEGADR